MFLQFIHLFLKQQGIIELLLKAITASDESDSIHKFVHLLWFAISTALIIAGSSA